MGSHFLLVGAAMGAVALGCGGGGGARPMGGAGTSGAGGIGGAAGSTGRGGDAAGGGVTTGGAGGASMMGTGGGADTTGSGGGAGTVGTGGTGGGADAGTGGTAPVQALDMNDVTILAPLPQSTATPVLLRGSDLADDGTALVQRALVDHLLQTPGTSLGLPADVYDRLQLVAVRFDLCDRHLPGACPQSEDARMRLVFQPLSDPSGADDVGFHAFYAIRNDEIAAALAALRDLAATAPPQAGALRVSPALSAANPEPYAVKLRAFVRHYGGDARAVRLTVNAQSFLSQQFEWLLRGVEKQGDTFVDIKMVGATDTRELIILGATASYLVTPMTDTPPGLLTVLNKLTFDPADAATQRNALAALAAVENPLSHTAETVACVGCHVSTVITQARASASIDPLTLPERYTSKYDLSTSGGQSAQTQTTLRALGYLRTMPMISQRVVNDTAQTLTEIEARTPSP